MYIQPVIAYTNTINKNLQTTNFQGKTNNHQDSTEKKSINNNSTSTKKYLLFGTIISLVSALAIGLITKCKKNIKKAKTQIPETIPLAKPIKNNLRKLQSSFGEMFGIKLSKQETVNLSQQYKEIFEALKNNPEDLKALSQLYRTINKNLGFKIPPRCTMEYSQSNLYASATPLGIKINLTKCKDNPQLMFQSLIHELTHIKQDKIAYATDSQKYLKAIFEREKTNNSEYYKRFMTEANGNEALAFSAHVKAFKENALPEIINAEPISPNSPLYKKGLAYIDNIRNYKSHDRFGLHEYKKQIIEAEAYNAGDKAVEIFKILTSK